MNTCSRQPASLICGQSLFIGVLLFGIMLTAGCAATKMNSTPAPSLSAGQLALNPASMNFGSVNVGASQSQSGTLTASSSPVTVSSATWNGTGYAVSGITFPVVIPARKTVPFTVTFSPQTSGNTAGTISFLSNATNAAVVEHWSGIGLQTSQHNVSLTWNPDMSSVLGYYVYRGAQSGGPYAKISTLQPGTSFSDTAVTSGHTYYYAVTALGTNSVESGYSNEAVANIP